MQQNFALNQGVAFCALSDSQVSCSVSTSDDHGVMMIKRKYSGEAKRLNEATFHKNNLKLSSNQDTSDTSTSDEVLLSLIDERVKEKTFDEEEAALLSSGNNVKISAGAHKSKSKEASPSTAEKIINKGKALEKGYSDLESKKKNSHSDNSTHDDSTSTSSSLSNQPEYSIKSTYSTGYYDGCGHGEYGYDSVVLTFDDGPSEYTGELLDILKTYGVKATFFILGSQINSESDRAIVRRMYAEGHIVASHSDSHPDFTTLSDGDITWEMKRTEEIIYDIIGVKPRYMRPPYGEYDDRVLEVLYSRGYKVINWDLDSHDWEIYSYNPYGIVSNVKDALEWSSKSRIVLFHDTYWATVDAQRTLIPWIKRHNRTIVPLSAVLGDHYPYR